MKRLGSEKAKGRGKVQKIEGLDGLPVWAQVVASMVFFLISAAAAYHGYFGKKGQAAAKFEDPKDAYVVSATFADAQAIRDLNREVKSLEETMRGVQRELRDMTREQERTTAEVADLGRTAREVLRFFEEGSHHHRTIQS